MPAQSRIKAPSFKFRISSPLDSVVRRGAERQLEPSLDRAFTSSSSPYPSTSRAHGSNPCLNPSSPLLHSQFRVSTATDLSSDRDSCLESSRSFSWEAHNLCEDESIYYHPSLQSDNGRSLTSTQTLSRTLASNQDNIPLKLDNPEMWQKGSSTADYNTPIPTVIVSSPDSDHLAGSASHHGKAPITVLHKPNFSRPRNSSQSSLSMHDRKQQVIERNRRHGPSHHSLLQNSSAHQSHSQQDRNLPPEVAGAGRSDAPTRSSLLSSPISPSTTSSSSLLGQDQVTQGTVLPRSPPSRSADSPTSLYSRYSYYNMDSPTQSPIASSRPTSRTESYSQTPASILSAPEKIGQRTPQDYLQLGIQYHEANELTESASWFEKSAKEQGGCGVGMLMWGLALRHGWGCEKNEKAGFKWLQKAAENAVDDLERTRGGKDVISVEKELVLAIYEVGQCFFQGWGVAKDQKMGVSYYRVAARLGDADAQSDLAFCLANGKGCKKDRKEAARWYREAVAQGASNVGLAWIYKEKYQ